MSHEYHVSDDPARAVATALVRYLDSLLHPLIALSGGSTPKTLFRLLASEFRNDIPWERMALFQVDERCVPPDHADSNWRMIRETLLDQTPVPASYRMKADESTGAQEYELVLGEHLPKNSEGVPVFDLILLGMGADGHTASLFPGTAALNEQSHWVTFNDVPQLNTRRLTLTFPVLNAARQVWYLCAGKDKATAFEQAKQGQVPAGQVTNAKWFIDSAVLGE